MDIFTHAVVGLATGMATGYPVTGLVAGVMPDLVLGIRRRAAPTVAYNYTHSFVGMVQLAVVALLVHGRLAGFTVLAAIFSHIFLDIFTHGEQWAPPLLYPDRTRYSLGSEWEWFNGSWFFGLCVAIIWVAACILFVM